jgi:hypothetical protein
MIHEIQNVLEGGALLCECGQVLWDDPAYRRYKAILAAFTVEDSEDAFIGGSIGEAIDNLS